MNEFFPYPVFLILKDKLCLIVGGGEVAYRKACEIAESGASLKIVAPEINSEFETLQDSVNIKILKKIFEPADMDGAFIVFAATNEEPVNEEVSRLAKSRGILVNVVDDPSKCDFYSGAVVKRGPLRIAVSTSGYSPFFAAGIKREIERLFGNNFGDYIKVAGEIRKKLIEDGNFGKEEKKRIMDYLLGEEAFNLFNTYGKDRLWEELMKIVSI